MTYLGQLEYAARNSTDVLLRKLLLDAIAELRQALAALHETPELESMQRVNCAWARAVRLYDQVRAPTPTGTPSAGLKEGALLQRAA